MMTIQELAKEALSYFEYTGENNPTKRDNIYTTKDETPEWVMSLIYDAHGDLLPDDYVYRFIVSALTCFEECDDPDNDMYEYVDNEVDHLYSRLFGWVSSHTTRIGYVDEGVEQGGYTSLSDALQRGQYEEIEEVYASVLDSLRQRLEELDEEEGDDEE